MRGSPRRGQRVRALTLFVLLPVLCASTPAAPLERFEFQQPHMGTAARIVLYTDDAADARWFADRAFDRITELDARLSDYRDTSELMQLSRRAGGPPVAVSEDLFTVLQAAQRMAHRTGGAFDVTVGPVTRLWRRARAIGETPDPARLAEAQKLVDYRNLQLVVASGFSRTGDAVVSGFSRTGDGAEPGSSRTQHHVRLLRPGMMLDLGGIAKGFAADQALRTLRQHGVSRALVALGGDIAAGEPPPGERAWRIAVAPFGTTAGAAPAQIALRGSAVSTSGDAEQFLEKDGVRYSHIITPSNGSAARERRSVTVVAPDGMTADAFATAITVLGPSKGLAIADGIPGAAALVVELTATGRREYRSSRW